ncbi:carbon-nitrogen hydrolase [Spinellus fusiger]|nr:carbon-nitrogen hydrolase [Spinellus fusiger]
MKLACCQFKPQWGARKENMTLADSLLDSYKPGDIDVLVLPEMAFTGYVFMSLEEVMPYLETATTSPTIEWAKQQALRLQCYVLVGYPEVAQENEATHHYNSQCCVNKKGELVHNYRKHFLFQGDETWAKEGPGFVSQEIKGLGQVGFGICMDINPYKFQASFEAYEFATYHVQHKSRWIFCSMAWLKSSREKEDDLVSTLLGYWALRLAPLRNASASSVPVFVVICNRTGAERGSTFAGGSCVLELSQRHTLLHGHLSSSENAVLVVDTLEP